MRGIVMAVVVSILLVGGIVFGATTFLFIPHGLTGPFWGQVVAGFNEAKTELASKGIDCVMYATPNPNAKDQVNAIETWLAKGTLGGLAIAPADNAALTPIINQLIAKGIPVIIFNVDDPTSNRLAYVGQNLFQSGYLDGQLLALAMGGKNAKGSVGLITGFFSIWGHMQRVYGFEAAMKQFAPNLKIVGPYQNQDSPVQGYSIAQSMIQANPDLLGIYNACGGSDGVAKAIKDAGKSGQIKLVCHDMLPEVIPYIEDGTIQFTVCQDPYTQGYEPMMLLYQVAIQHQTLSKVYYYTSLQIVTLGNLHNYMEILYGQLGADEYTAEYGTTYPVSKLEAVAQQELEEGLNAGK